MAFDATPLPAALLEEPELSAAPIPLGATRPAMVPRVGIPLAAALPLGVVASEVQMVVTGLWGVFYAALVFGAIALPLRAWVAYDWYGLEVLRVWSRTAGPCFDADRWGGTTLSPAPLSLRALRREPPRGTAA